MKVQIQPNHADHISGYKDEYLQQMFDNELVIVQPKYDGERMLIHFDGPNIYCTSRRISKKTNEFTELQDKLQDLVKVYRQSNLNLKYTVLDCECYSKDWSTIVGILHSLPERAKELAKINIPHFAVFDCLFYDGVDLRNSQYCGRLCYAIEIIQKINYEPLHLVQFMNKDYKPSSKLTDWLPISSKEDWQQCMENAIKSGFEGVVIKSVNRKYYEKGASLKCKKFETLDVVVYSYKPGNGKYANMIGALEIGYYEPTTDSIIRIGNVNCSTDEEREKWTTNWESMKYSVIEVKCQEITNKSLRHPVYLRLREDKNYKECTRETILRNKSI